MPRANTALAEPIDQFVFIRCSAICGRRAVGRLALLGSTLNPTCCRVLVPRRPIGPLRHRPIRFCSLDRNGTKVPGTTTAQTKLTWTKLIEIKLAKTKLMKDAIAAQMRSPHTTKFEIRERDEGRLSRHLARCNISGSQAQAHPPSRTICTTMGVHQAAGRFLSTHNTLVA